MHHARMFRIWTDVTGLALPLVVIVLYVVDGPSAVTLALTLVFLGSIFGMWLITTVRRVRSPRRR